MAPNPNTRWPSRTRSRRRASGPEPQYQWPSEERILTEEHHDIEVQDETGKVLAKKRLPEGLAGMVALHELLGRHVPAGWADLDPAEAAGKVVVGIETDRGPWVAALVAAGYRVYAINPTSAARYRQRHSMSGAKADTTDAHLLAEIVRVDRAHHRGLSPGTARTRRRSR